MHDGPVYIYVPCLGVILSDFRCSVWALIARGSHSGQMLGRKVRAVIARGKNLCVNSTLGAAGASSFAPHASFNDKDGWPARRSRLARCK